MYIFVQIVGIIFNISFGLLSYSISLVRKSSLPWLTNGRQCMIVFKHYKILQLLHILAESHSTDLTL